MNLSSTQIDTIRNLILDDTREACGVVYLDENKETVLFIDSYGEESGRGSCTNVKYMQYIWHTHPLRSKPYPSYEDILKVLKPHGDKNLPYTSLIFTNLGLWRLNCFNKKQYSTKTLKYIVQSHIYCVKNLYKKFKSNDINQHTIHSFIDCFQDKMIPVNDSFQISFKNWKELENGIVI